MTGAEGPSWVAQLEMAVPFGLESVSERDQLGYGRARVLVRLHGEPIGFVDVPVPAEGLTADDVSNVAWRELGDTLQAHLDEDGIAYGGQPDPEGLGPRTRCRAADAWRQPIDVVVCTRDRPGPLRDSLQSLRALQYPAFRVMVIDNAPSDDATRRCFAETVGRDTRFHYVEEPRPGLSRARNRGLAEAASSHVAFTDDDVVVDPWWLDGIARGFARREDVGCVTGIVPSVSLDTPAERYFDRRVSWSKALRPQLYALREPPPDSPLFPFNAGSFGTGANFAVERQTVDRVGGFDEALGAGSLARGGEDLDMFVQLLRTGHAIAHEPSAIGWHSHRAAAGALRTQMSGYGVALGAYLTKQLSDPNARSDLLRRAPRGVLHMLSLWRNAGAGRERGDLDLILAELFGIARGPLAYHRARRAVTQSEHTRA